MQAARMQLLHGDCLEHMRQMETDSVDLVFCSPPYEAQRTYNIDFKLKGEAWVEWAADRYVECCRVSRGLVAWVVQGYTRKFEWSASPAMLMVELKRRGVKLRNPPVFHRVGIPGSGGPDWLRSDYEWIVCGSRERGRLPWSDNTAMGHPPKWAPGGAMSHRVASGSRVNQWGHSKGSGGTQKVDGKVRSGLDRPSYKETKQYDGVTKANPGNVINVKVGGGLMGSKLAHENEAPFPEKLAEFFVKSFCPPGGTVLDPFSGSGTTAAVAKRLGRNAVGIDIRDSQIDLAHRRLAEVEAVSVVA